MKRNMVRKTLTGFLCFVVLTCLIACASPEKKIDGLVNHMTQKEKGEAKETSLMLLEHPWEEYCKDKSKPEYEELAEKIVFIPKIGALVRGKPVFNALPPKGYDGGSGTVVFNLFDPDTGDTSPKEIRFKNYANLKKELRSEYDDEIAAGYPQVPADEEYDCLIRLYDAVINGQTETMERNAFDEYMEYYWNGGADAETDSFYWQMDDKAVVGIKDHIHEYHLFDEELDLDFTVHVTTPPGYDKNRSYPALVMTDAVWRFNDVTSLYEAMASGEADPQLLITIGFAYDTDGWDNDVRGNILCDHKKEFLDFITDNMMPYLSSQYSIDYGSSTLFGHSQGGVFTHYAAFNYDRYENRPFKKYIIGSPTFWTPYFAEVQDYKDYKDEYGFFERQDSYDRELVITAGDQEDEDYSEYYGDNDSTTEGVAHLKERLESHGVTTYKVKMYNSHHYQYVSDMLKEYLKDEIY